MATVDHECVLCGNNAEIVGPLPQHGRKRVRGIACERCGTYFITPQVGYMLKGSESEPHRRAMLSAITRERSEQGNPITICSGSYDPQGKEPIGLRVDEILDTMVPRSTPERMDRALLNLARKSRHLGDAVEVAAERDEPLLFAENADALRVTLKHMVERGLLDEGASLGQSGEYALTVEGRTRIDELKRLRPESRQAFVAMWFNPKLNEAYDKGLRSAIKDAGYEPKRIDMDEFNEKIDDRIIAEIRRSRFLVADVTAHRQAVYFEVGFAMGLGLPVILTCRKDHLDACSFDTRQYNHIEWESPDDLREKLKNRIAATIV